MTDPPRAPRRFKPDLVETTTSSSSTSSSNRQQTPLLPPPDIKQPSPRKFAPQLVETTTRSSEQPRESTPEPAGAAGSPKPKRRFAPQPVETTTRSRKAQQDLDDPPEDQVPLLPHEQLSPPTPKRKFAPMPVETTTRSHRAPHVVLVDRSHNSSPSVKCESPKPQEPAAPKPKRKFTPQLLETATRSRKAGDTVPAVLPSDKTNVSPGDALHHTRPPPLPLPPANTPNGSVLNVLRPIPNRQGSLHVHYNTPRQHSYRVPSLDVIESSESEGEAGSPGLSRSHSISSTDSFTAYKHATRQRESVDDRFSGYLLALAARAAEKQLREQEAAAFATSDFHEPVAHYANREDSGEDVADEDLDYDSRSYRRDSGDEQFALEELRKHGEKVRKLREQEKTAAPQYNRRKTFNVEFDGEAHQDAWTAEQIPRNMIGGYQRDPDLKSMRKAAAPPMLGGDIDFPRCASPDHARFDVTQGSDFLRNSMCYLTDQGMWDGTAKRPEMIMQKSQEEQRKTSSAGLWGGTCTPADAKLCHVVPTGLVTPARTPGAFEKDDPFTQLSSGTSSGTSVAGKRPGPPAASTGYPSPPSSSSAFHDDMMELETKLDAEFSEAFVTQVYNYLSLGYPALARKFDEELSKISGVPIEDLRSDDKLAEAHGYLRLGDEEPTSDDTGVVQTDCKRWLALRSYCREWGRQIAFTKKGGPEDPNRAWGLPVRKGSWSN